MSSKILYDIRNNEIKRCQPKPHGSAGLPSFRALCMSARIPENEKEYMETCIIERESLTRQAQRNLRIVDGEATLKPKAKLSADKTEVNISENEEFTLTINIINTIDSDDFGEIYLLINDAEITVNITDNQGSQEIELSDTGEYIIRSNDDRFRANQVKVEAV